LPNVAVFVPNITVEILPSFTVAGGVPANAGVVVATNNPFASILSPFPGFGDIIAAAVIGVPVCPLPETVMEVELAVTTGIRSASGITKVDASDIVRVISFVTALYDVEVRNLSAARTPKLTVTVDASELVMVSTLVTPLYVADAALAAKRPVPFTDSPLFAVTDNCRAAPGIKSAPINGKCFELAALYLTSSVIAKRAMIVSFY
jgi:hypothetical protein